MTEKIKSEENTKPAVVDAEKIAAEAPTLHRISVPQFDPQLEKAGKKKKASQPGETESTGKTFDSLANSISPDPQPVIPSLEGWLDEESLQRTVNSIKSRNLDDPYVIRLIDLVEHDPQNATSWYWLADKTRADIEKRACLQMALKIDPHHQPALQAWERLAEKTQPVYTRPKSTPLPEYEGETEVALSHTVPTQRVNIANPIPPTYITEFEDAPPSEPVYETETNPPQTATPVVYIIWLAVLSGMVVLLLGLQIWNFIRIAGLEATLAQSQQTIQSFQQMVTDLIVKVEMLQQ